LLYLLDANVLISAHEDYYGIDQVPQFWDWLLKVAKAGQVKMPFEIHQEIAISEGPLSSWITVAATKKILVLDEEVDQDLVERVLNDGKPERWRARKGRAGPFSGRLCACSSRPGCGDQRSVQAIEAAGQSKSTGRVQRSRRYMDERFRFL
jgi:hypothetical protein